MNKKILKFGLSGIIGLAAFSAMAQQPIEVTINGQQVNFNGMPPQEVNGRVLVPLRGVFEDMGAYVHWNSYNQTIDAQRANTTVQLQIGNHQATVNGRSVYLDVPPELMSDTTMVPLRFVSEALGADVNWDDASQTVAITTNVPDQYNPGHPQRGYHPGDNRSGQGDNQPPEHVQRIQERHGMRAILNEDTVIPVRLDNPLSSDHSQSGDRFTATLDTHGSGGYDGLPAGTRIEGHVTEADPQDGNHPGILNVAFDRLMLPDGTAVPIRGRLIGLDNESVTRGRGGVMIANPRAQQSGNNTMAYVGYGAGAGAVLGIISNGHVLTDAAIGGALGYLLHQIGQHPERARNVYLNSGTEMGVRIMQRVQVD